MMKQDAKPTKEDILKTITSGCLFEYDSYDHKKAKEEYNQGVNDIDLGFEVSCWDIPQELKDKYKVVRKGKLRSILFNPKGDIKKFYVGARYAKPFYPEDIGTKLRPIKTTKEA